MSSQTDVIIIGAGAAGLSAAKELARLGLSFVLLEGSHRIGGRAHSEEIAPGVWFDRGCAYLTTSNDPAAINPFVEIAKSVGAEIGEDHKNLFDTVRFHCNGKQLAAKEEAARREYFEACDTAIEQSARRGEDRAISELIDLGSPYASPYKSGMTTSNTLDVDQISAAEHANAIGDAEVPILRGYGNLVAQWGDDVPVSLDTKVEAIDWSPSDVGVETVNGTLRGRCVLSTVSNGILAAEHIRFKPGLPNWKLDAINGLPTGTENKIGVHFDKDIFGPDGRGVHQTWTDQDEGAEFEASVMGLNVAVVFVGGRHAVWLEEQGQQAGHDFAVNQIADVFGNDIRKSVTRSIVTTWTKEPWTLGSYACALPGQSHQRKALARPIDDKLFFAGEATMHGVHGSCHGAYLSGVRAAHGIAGATRGRSHPGSG